VRVRAPWRAVAFTALIVVMLAAALWESRGFGFRPGLFPWVIGGPMLALSLLLLGLQLAGRERAPAGGGLAPGSEVEPAEAARRTAAILGWVAGTLAAIWLLGFVIGGALCTFLSLIGSRERWTVALGETAVVTAIVYAVFVRALHVPFPPAQLFAWLAPG
jgi:hypothetical protein